LTRAIALKLADLGCNIVIADVDDAAAENTVTEIRNKKVKANFYRVDVTNIDDITKLRDAVSRDMGSVDILVINANCNNFKMTFKALINVNRSTMQD